VGEIEGTVAEGAACPAAESGAPRRGTDAILERFRPLQELGSGSFGVVWRALDLQTGHEVALKLISSKQSRAATAREVELLSSLRHDNIVSFVASGRVGQLDYLAMECAPGRSLDSPGIAGHLSPQTVARIGLEVLDALSHAHAQDIVHRDIKPENVIFQEDPWSVKVTDFGVGANYQAMRRSVSRAGTYLFMAPEQLCGRVTPACDLWATGAMLHYLVTGQPPLPAGSLEDLAKALFIGRPNLHGAGIPSGLRPVLDILLSKDYEERQRRLPEAQDLLASLLSGATKGKRANSVGTASFSETDFRQAAKRIDRLWWRRNRLAAMCFIGASVAAFGLMQELKHLEEEAETAFADAIEKGGLRTENWQDFRRVGIRSCKMLGWAGDTVARVVEQAIANGDLKCAGKLLRRGLKKDILHYRLLVLTAQIHFLEGNRGKARDACRRVLDEYDFSPEAQYVLAAIGDR
jgi:hypothetical protein